VVGALTLEYSLRRLVLATGSRFDIQRCAHRTGRVRRAHPGKCRNATVIPSQGLVQWQV